MAIAVILIVLSGIIEQSSLFLLAAASFITGVIQRRFSVKLSAVFIAGAFLVGMFLAPQKLYCFTFAGFSVYVSITEYLRQKDVPFVVCIVIKGICYHILLVLALAATKYFVGFDILFAEGWVKKLSGIPVLFIIVAVAAAEVLWLIFDRAYIFFQDRYGSRLGRWLDD